MPVFAQDATTGLEEVVVTAQRREQRLLDVPVAVTAIAAAQIEERGLNDIHDISALAPNLHVSVMPGTSSNSQISIRGQVTVNSTIMTDPTVGMYVDGVFVGKAVGSVVDMVDLERVEVLRGPQGTLYGRNTLAGAVNFVTRKPTGVFGGTASLDVGNYNEHTVRASVDLPAMGIVNATISGRSERRDGWVKVGPDPFGNVPGPAPISDTYDVHSDAGRVALDFNFSDAFKAAYRFDINRSENNLVYAQVTGLDSGFFGGFGIPLADYVHTDRQDRYSTNVPTFEYTKVQGHSLTLSYDLADHLQLKSITGYRDLHRQHHEDVDGSPLDLVDVGLDVHYHAFSQEVQLLGSVDRWNYVAGVYYSKDHGYAVQPLKFFGIFGPFGSSTDSMYAGGAETYAAYAQVDYKLTDRLTLTGGLRYTREKKDFIRYLHQLASPGAEITSDGWRDTGADVLDPLLPSNVSACNAYGRNAVCSDTTFSATTPTVSAAYKITDDFNVYARYAEGYKSGGYNGETNFISEVQTPYKPVKQKAYELGAKAVFWDGRAQVNAAVFENKTKNLQLDVFLGTGSVASVTRNAGSATTRGFELEAALQLTPGWRLGMGYGYLDAKYNEFIDAGVNVANNRAFPHAPKNTFNANIDGLLGDLGFGRLRLLADYTYVSKIYYYPYQLVEVNPTQQVASNTLVAGLGLANAKLLLSDIRAGSGTAEISLWVKNLTDKAYKQNVIDFGPGFGNLHIANFGTPRTYGAQVVFRW